MYRYIIKNKGLYSVYAILLVVSSTMSVFFAFVLSEIMNLCCRRKSAKAYEGIDCWNCFFISDCIF